MSVLDKLFIRGIRSFGPRDDEKVKFTTPLTLILGQNGCGKTTIIECLKYALTSDLPAGTDSGRGFVNDPNLSNKNSTKGYIKLKFKDCKGDYITVGKFLEVSKQAGGVLKFKSVNPTIRWEDSKGHTEDIAGRCVDIDLYSTQKLNVSKAIINDVIFCHQENSSWPLDEAKKLKEKFDQIFGSAQYNKCVEKLIKHIKERKGHIKVLKEQFETKRMAKRNTEKLREDLAERETKLEDIQRIIHEKESEIEPLQIRLNEINELIDTLSAHHQKLTGFETTLKGVIEHQNALKKHLNIEYEGTDVELNNEILNFDSFQELAKNDIIEKENEKNKIDSKVDEINKIIQNKQVTFGQLKQEEKQHTKRCEELKDIVQKSKVKFDVVTAEDEPVADILYKLKTSFKRNESSYNESRKNIETEEKELQTGIDNIRDKFAAAKESYSSKNKLILQTNQKIDEAKAKLSRLSFSNSQQESIERRIKDAEEALVQKKSDFNEDGEQQELEELDAQIHQKDQMQSKLEREHRTLQQNYVTEQRIEEQMSDLDKKKREIDDLSQKHQDNFRIIFAEDVPHEKIEQSIFRVQKTEDARVKALTKNISAQEKKIASLEVVVKHTSEKLQFQKDELNRDKTKIENVCLGRPFSEVLNEAYSKKEKLQKDKGTYRSAKLLFEQFISEFERDSPCCPVCTTDFSSKKSMVPSIITTLRRKIEDIPRKLTEIEMLLKKEEELYNKLQQLQSVNENIQMLEEAKIPLIEEEYQQNMETLEESKINLAALKNDLIAPQNLVETCSKVIADAALIDRLNLEVKRSDNSIENLKRDLVNVASKRTLGETETQLSKLKAELSNLRKQYRTKRDLFDETKESIQKLNGRLQLETQKKLEIQKLLQEQPLLEKQIQEYRKNNAQLEEDKKKLLRVTSELEKELAGAEKNRNDVIKRNKKLLDENRSDIDARRRLIDEIEKLQNIIKIYESGNNKLKLENLLKDLENCNSNIAKLEQGKKELVNSIVKKKEELASQESKLRSLKDNKELRVSRIKSKELELQIANLKKQIGHHNSKTICEERRAVINKIDSIQTDISKKLGKEDEIKDSIRSTKMELNKKEHKEALIEYKKKYYELRVEELAVSDLEVYTEALEKSILRFHKERMVQINMTIRELWRNIYKGNDIDYIEIQTVDDIGGGATRRRSYNYKVIQVKKGTELEMRGRCSAGQKVLACLVIRMALAETFSANCGILALDEPTTNLDRDNIMSLSDALSRIISVREKQKSFQLLIITHDEEFLQTLTRDQSVSFYYRVQRNHDGFSEIKKEVI